MSCMKLINVRDLQRDLRAILDEVEGGATFEIKRRNRSIARIVPHPAATIPKPWPNIMDRLENLFGKGGV